MIHSIAAARWSSTGSIGSIPRPLPPCNAVVPRPRFPLARSPFQVNYPSTWIRRFQTLSLASTSVDSSPEMPGSGRSLPEISVTSIVRGIAACFLGWTLLGAGNLVAYAASAARADPSSIGTSALGIHIADFLRKSSWPDEAIVFTLASLPVLELRGAIPVGYWMKIDPLKLFLLAVAGNMVPVPLILLYLERFATFLTARSPAARKAVDAISKSTRRKAGPIQEFKWLGLMLFVAVPFPGTGAWTGAMASVALGMPFWSSLWANFFGVAIAGILVNLLVSVGLSTATLVGAVLFAASTFMWSALRFLARSKQ